MSETKVPIIAIIPARGRSKRIAKKNIRLFHGKPIISYPIKAALETNLFDRVLVSTDCDEIAEVSKSYGAEVPFTRPAELSGDHVMTAPVLMHALDWLKENRQEPKYFCILLATSPFVRSEDIERGYDITRETEAVSVFSVTTFPYPIFRSLKMNDNSRLEMFWPEHLLTRSQDLPEAYHDAGHFYWAETKRYREEQRMFSSDAVPVVIPRWLVQDIDTEEDWIRAEMIFKVQRSMLSKKDTDHDQ
jgi:pseudaminic acid cytidylyltransferase